MKLNLVFLSFFLSAFLFAQDHKTCGTDMMVEKALKAEPQLKAYRKLLQQQADSLLANGFLSKSEDEIHIIPVVIHVMHTGGSNNISDEQVHDALRIINEDFSKENADTTQIVDEFQAIVADVGVQFKLAQLDPNGNCTKGITRNYTPLTNDAGENVKDIVKWDPRMYLNVWVVSNITSGAGGYSYYPGSAPNNDDNAGVVILNSQFGSIGAANGGNFSSRSLTHEIGHYLNLPHTWGSTNENHLEENCDADDYVDDTPNTIGSNLGCVLNQNTCGSLDNVQNYMDYSSCAKMYTEGQKTKMRLALETGYIWANAARNNLWTEENLWLTGTHEEYTAPDCLAIIDFDSESTIACPNANINWNNYSYNYDSATSYEWLLEGATPNTSSEANPTVIYENPGVYSATLSITTTGGTSTKEIENAIYIQNAEEVLDAPRTITFSNSNFPSSSVAAEQWYIDESLEGDAWNWTNAVSSVGSGSVRVRSDAFVGAGARNLYSPTFDLTNIEAPCYMYYDYAYARKSTQSADQLRVKVSNNCGVTWQNRLTKNTDNLVTVPESYYFNFTPSADAWETQKISLNAWSGDDQVQVLFEFTGSEGNYLYIDNIRFGVPLLSIDELTAKTLQLEIYPNPNNGDARVKFNLLNSQSVELKLIDLLGTELISTTNEYRAGQHQIDLKSLKSTIEPGIYFLTCRIGTYRETQQVIVY